MTKGEMEKLAAATLAALPAAIKSRIDNLVITVREHPTPAQARKDGTDLLGLYEGVPLSERGTEYSGILPDKITLFKKNLESVASTPKQLEQEVRRTILHELAHHFGFSDEELLRKGEY